MGLAVGYHMCRKYETAINVINAYEDSVKNIVEQMDYETSELVLYKNRQLFINF